MKALNSVANPPELYVTTFSFKQLVFSLNLFPPWGSLQLYALTSVPQTLMLNFTQQMLSPSLEQTTLETLCTC